MLGDDIPVRIDCWDGSTIAPTNSDVAGTLRLLSPDAVRRLLWSPNELGSARAFVAGELEFDGDIFEVVGCRPRGVGGCATTSAALGRRGPDRGGRLQLIGRPLPPPPEEAPSAVAGTRDGATPRPSATTTTSATTSTRSCSVPR